MFDKLKQDLINSQVREQLKSRGLKSITAKLDKDENVIFLFHEEETFLLNQQENEYAKKAIAENFKLKAEIAKLKTDIEYLHAEIEGVELPKKNNI